MAKTKVNIQNNQASQLQLIGWQAVVCCVVLVSCGLSPGVGAACSPQKDFVPVPEAQYDRNYSSITTPGARPLGYDSGIIYYLGANQPNPCIRVTGTAGSGRRVEVMVQTVPATLDICVRDSTQTEIDNCASGTINLCQEASADTVNFEFYCKTGCEAGDINFWYRFTVSPEGEDPEEWCFDRTGTDFPNTLGNIIPPNHVNNPVTRSPPTSGLTRLLPAWRSLLIMLVVVFLFSR
uniref:Uncharacterized protein n=1 Tax=Branchiostoma floridae TaxID=7739 RepID=C3ZA97_BRAFL|eukprot:XP_002594479.1 hypothetical protein BRAFLDRAFT_124958 [Branchiostoma floridae]